MLNRRSTGLGLKAEINRYPFLTGKIISSTCRKAIRFRNIFSQLGEGEIEIDLRRGGEKGRHRAPASGADAGKSLHDQHPDLSFVDLNRSGVALMEIVSRPDMRSAAEAQAYVKKLRAILRYLGTCDGNMEQSLRADVNVSVRKPGGDWGRVARLKM